MARSTEFFTMDPEELGQRLVESRRELLNLRFQLATGQLDNVAQIKLVRRDIARAMTVLRAIEIAEAEGVTYEPPAPRPERVRAQRRDAERAAEEPVFDTEDSEEGSEAPRARPRRRAKASETEHVEIEPEAGDEPDEEPAAEEPAAEQPAARRPRPRRIRRSAETSEVDEEQ